MINAEISKNTTDVVFKYDLHVAWFRFAILYYWVCVVHIRLTRRHQFSS